MKEWRKNSVLVILILLLAAVTGRLVYIQVLNFQYWRALAQGQQNIFNDALGDRGAIYFTENDFPAATNKDSFFVHFSPSEIEDKENTAKVLSQVLSMEEQEIMEKTERQDTFFVMVKENLNDTEIEAINDLKLPGVHIDKKRIRHYSFENTASHILGFVGVEGEGQYGVEGYYNESLSGDSGLLQGERGPKGFLFFSKQKSGNDIILTLDYNIQFLAEKLLESAAESLKIESGQIIVMRPETGEIIALADFPNFNPNNYSEYAKDGNLDIFQNAATQKIYEPGSTFKAFTMAAGLEEKVISPQTTYIDEGFVKFGGSTVYNYDGRKYGQMTMTGVLEKSINTGAVFVEELIPHDVYLEYLEKFGFFKKTDADIPEVYSENKELKKGYAINFATCSFGQGIEITPLQLVRAFSAIANGGTMVTPYIIKKEGEKETEPQILERVISPNTAAQLSAMLVSVVENGYAKTAKIPGYYIAGKTGTAQVPEGGGYSKDKTIQSFVGYAPAFDPEFVILVKLDNPQAKTAEYSAVPLFHDLAKYIIDYWQIPPDYVE